MDGLKVAIAVFAAAGAASGQFGVVCTTDVPYATAFNSSHKLAASEFSGMPGDTMTLVFQSRAGIWSCLGVQGVTDFSWTRPVMMYLGQNPGIDEGLDGDRHLVWQFPDTSSGAWQTYYRNFEYRMAPLDVSRSRADALHPDVWGDSAGVAHVVWEDYRYGRPAIYYRTCNEGGVLSDTFRVSTTTTGRCFFPSVEYFSAYDEMAVVWQQVDSTSYTPYSIRLRCRTGGVWRSETVLASHARPLRHPSLDRGSPGEGFACAWEDSSSGNMEAHFEGGNGGGYQTSGRSVYPVHSHLGDIWSYLFWQEESSGTKDVRTHFFYGFPPPGRWYAAWSLRQWLGINEDIMHPACLGATAVWTQGSSPPYKVMWAFFDYPIALVESREPSAVGALRVRPNPFRAAVAIRLPPTANRSEGVGIYDASGRCVRVLAASREPSAVSVWNGSDSRGRPAPSGVYVVRAGQHVARVVKF